ncbi:MAG: SUMF1/EgtB/PvdO family nonheme iron enzyme [Candidatus Omnitrophota bacterium]
MNKKVIITALLFVMGCFAVHQECAFANNLAVSNVTMSTRDPANDTFILQFDVSWNNSWRNKINHDAIWFFVKVDTGTAPYSHCLMKTSGASPTGFSAGSDTNLAIYVPSDKTGAFLRPSSYRAMGSVSSTSVQLKVDYGASSCNIADTASITPYVYGIEMVYVPQGEFYVGDFATSTSSFKQGSADDDPWYISSEGTLLTTSGASDGYYYVDSTATVGAEFLDGDIFTIPAAFPKGYQAFYCMKYEVTEGQYVDFINSLSPEAAKTRDITDTTGKNSDSVIVRNTITINSAVPTATTTRSDRALNYISWMDLSAYLDWAALRPMTELEYEKVARGPVIPVKGEYAWGTTDIIRAVTISISPEDGTETVTTTDGIGRAYVNQGGRTFSRGDVHLGVEYTRGPLRVGIFATATADRVTAGAGYYGAMELSGNVSEMVVIIGNSWGITYTGGHGDGALTTSTTNQGNANVTGWVLLDPADSARGITGYTGSADRGDGWTAASGTISYRRRYLDNVGMDGIPRKHYIGGRGVRTYN